MPVKPKPAGPNRRSEPPQQLTLGPEFALGEQKAPITKTIENKKITDPALLREERRKRREKLKRTNEELLRLGRLLRIGLENMARAGKTVEDLFKKR